MNLENVKKVKRSKAFTVLDAVITAMLVVAIGVAAWAIYRKPPRSVVITAPDYERSFPIDIDTEVRLEHLTVHIESGKVWVSDADCADKICENTGSISRAGQSIVCLPHGITVTVSGESDLHWESGK
ncbi:MAG: NusG domain II-containing protein [Roseburia sp.]|nr:NusG domain II-containing protein [Roseburia sp.]